MLWLLAQVAAAHFECWAQALPAGSRQGEGCSLEPGGESAVLDVVGAQTLRLADGRFVRLAEVLVPRPAMAQGFDLGAAAHDYLRAVALGRKVEVKFGGARRDRYGIALGHVFVGGEPAVWLQEGLVSSGFALVYPQPDNHACSARLLASEAAARRERRGHWALAAFQVIRADDARTLMNLAQSYQIVEGTVDHVHESAGRVTLYFTGDERNGLAAFIEAAAKRRLGGGSSTEAWTSKRLRLRGWLDRRRVPTLEVTEPEQVEVVAGAGRAATPPQDGEIGR